MSSSPNDLDELKPALAAGDEEAFSMLLDLVGARMRRAALRMLGSNADADDALQEVFVGLVKSRHRLANVVDLNAYMFVSLRRAVARLAKQQRKHPASSDSLDEVAETPITDSSTYDASALNEAIQNLPPQQREIIVLKIDAQLTFARIASMLGISANTAASRYRYGLEKLRSELRTESC
jgi:RNA polymerase sigma-70 factor (ECF subfamily)